MRDRPRLRAVDAQTRLDSGPIQDFDQHRSPAVFLDLHRPTGDSPGRSVLSNLHGGNAQRVEEPLHGRSYVGVIGCVIQKRESVLCLL